MLVQAATSLYTFLMWCSVASHKLCAWQILEDVPTASYSFESDRTPCPLGSRAQMIDDGELDWKLIAINAADEHAADINDVDDIEKYYPGKNRLLQRLVVHSFVVVRLELAIVSRRELRANPSMAGPPHPRWVLQHMARCLGAP